MFLCVRNLGGGIWAATATLDGYSHRAMASTRHAASWGAVQGCFHWAQFPRHHRPWQGQAPEGLN